MSDETPLPPPRIPRRLDPYKRRRIEEHLPRWWQERRQRRRARLLAMTRAQRFWRRIGLDIVWLLGAIAALMVAAVVLFYTLSNVPRPEDLPVPQAALVEYSDGSTLAQLGTNRIPVALSQVPKPVQWAVLAAEDRNFYSEPGVSIKGTLRAALHDITGGDTQGGSGITQQYVKNAYLNSSRTLTRKLRELAIAVKLSRQYSKDQILEWYLNTVYFGRGAYGIEAASQAYFGVPVGKLGIAQGALLAGLLRAPSYYDPAQNPGPAKERWRYVMDGLVATHHLTPAQEAKIAFPKTKADQSESTSDPDGVIGNAVTNELEQLGISEATINTKGLRIQTTINRNAQADAVNAIHEVFANLTPKQRNMKNALVAENPQNGAIIAYYGGPYGKNYAGQPDYFDYAGQGWRPAGSSFKPYTLATALTQNLQGKKPAYTINSVVDGSYTRVIDGTTIQNDPSDRQYSGHVSLAFAMKVSLNTAFDGLAYDIGPADVAKTARAAGIAKTHDGRPTLTSGDGRTYFGIGIGDYPVRPLDQAVGFGTFADGGVAHEGYLVQQVTDANGHVLYKHKDTNQRALDPRVANDVTLTLEPVANFSGVPLAEGRPSAAKTGTEGILSGPDKGGNSDAWMVGYTPQVSTAVWVGSGDSSHAIYSASGGAEYGRDLPGKAWKAFMDSYLTGQPQQSMASTQEIFNEQDVPAPSTSSAPSPSPSTAPTTPSSSSPTPSPSTSRPTPSRTPTPAPSTSLSLLPPITTPPTPTKPRPTKSTPTVTPTG